MAGCLDGIRVLELARYQAGPRGGMVLSTADRAKLKKYGAAYTGPDRALIDKYLETLDVR